MDVNEQIEKFKDFINDNYKIQLHEAVQQGRNSLVINFKDLQDQELELSEHLLQEPEEVIKSAEYALDHIDLPEENKLRIRIRFSNLPKTQKVRIADIRSDHRGSFIWIEGVIKEISDVRPRMIQAQFECAGCGNTLSILQNTSKFEEPTRCPCKWKGKFRLLNEQVIDSAEIKIEQLKDDRIERKERNTIQVRIEEDLTKPGLMNQLKNNIKITVLGVVKYDPYEGGDYSIYANNLVLEDNTLINGSKT